jgi:hypothetical protein
MLYVLTDELRSGFQGLSKANPWQGVSLRVVQTNSLPELRRVVAGIPGQPVEAVAILGKLNSSIQAQDKPVDSLQSLKLVGWEDIITS